LLVENGKVKTNVCFRMELGEKDESGRARPIRIEGSEFHMEVDSVISAIGQEVDLDFFPGNRFEIDSDTLETNLPNVFAGGDAVRGASSLINAIADGKRAAQSIKKKSTGKAEPPTRNVDRDVDVKALQVRQARRVPSPRSPNTDFDTKLDFGILTDTLDEKTAKEEAVRCLQCDVICNVCTTVCPNRANVAYDIIPSRYRHQQVIPSKTGPQIQDLGWIEIKQPHQIINIGDFCNECGNCSTFCPTNGAPYRVKPNFYLTKESLLSSENGYRLHDGELHFKSQEGTETIFLQNDRLVYDANSIRVKLDMKTLTIDEIDSFSDQANPVDLKHGVTMGVMFLALRSCAPLGF
jgi:putative selenate reductase